MSNDVLTKIELNVELIQGAKKELADLKEEKIIKRSEAWSKAEGTAKEKEDFVRSEVASIDKEIGYKEANIEYLYNMNELLYSKLVYLDE